MGKDRGGVVVLLLSELHYKLTSFQRFSYLNYKLHKR